MIDSLIDMIAHIKKIAMLILKVYNILFFDKLHTAWNVKYEGTLFDPCVIGTKSNIYLPHKHLDS